MILSLQTSTDTDGRSAWRLNSNSSSNQFVLSSFLALLLSFHINFQIQIKNLVSHKSPVCLKSVIFPNFFRPGCLTVNMNLAYFVIKYKAVAHSAHGLTDCPGRRRRRRRRVVMVVFPHYLVIIRYKTFCLGCDFRPVDLI